MNQKNIKTILLFLSSLLIIVFSFIMPKLFIKIEDLSKEKEVFAISKKERKIDVQAEKIYLVRFIHDIYDLKDEKIYDNNKNVYVSSSAPVTTKIENTSPGEQIKNEISKMISNEIIKKIDFNNTEDYYEVIKTFGIEYSIITAECVADDFGLGIGIEEKTGKIISLDFPKKILRDDVDKKKQLENYAKYLDLDIIGDWKYKDQVLSSEKAQLSIVLEEKENVCMLTIAPTTIYEEYESSKYEVVEKKK